MKRTDIHSPSSPDFDPQAYDCYGVWDNYPELDGSDLQERMKIINDLVGKGYTSGHGSSCQCGHCGATLRYAALMVHKTVKEYIFVGETCLNDRFQLTKEVFQTLRKKSALNRERSALTETRNAFLAEHPELAVLMNEDRLAEFNNDFIRSIARNLRSYGNLSERQTETVIAAIERETNRNADRSKKDAEWDAIKRPAPEGRVQVKGKIVTTKWQDSIYGSTFKMLVVCDGFKVWSSVPASIDSDDIKGQTVEFTATLTRSDSDESFAYGKRPSKAQLIA